MSDRVAPDPVQAAEGVWSVALPFPNPLVHTFTHLARVKDGVIAVDIGWESDECWAAFEAGMASAGLTLGDLTGVVVTHVHPDHYGLVERIRTQTSAWIAMHPLESAQLGTEERDRQRHLERMAQWLRVCGAPASEFEALRADADDLVKRMYLAQPDHVLPDGSAVPGTDGSIRAVHTPGHTPGHLCFYDRDRNVIYTGDHVLPRVTPNISRRPTSDPDPLADFVSSMDKIRPYGDALVLPGHEWAFDGLTERLDFLAAHHAERLDEIEATVNAGAGTVWEVARGVRWHRPFESLQSRARRSALGESYSHLIRLAATGRIGRDEAVPERWTPVLPIN
jgi:glyoxylase-like metal-dependent hydrolase (beta-lactamase superfamily II)